MIQQHGGESRLVEQGHDDRHFFFLCKYSEYTTYNSITQGKKRQEPIERCCGTVKEEESKAHHTVTGVEKRYLCLIYAGAFLLF